jgi:ribose-phosphate pyrophosphokinase
LTDDMCATGGTLVHAAEVCMELGAKKVIAIIGHGLFLENAIEKIMKSPIEFLLVTNSIPIPQEIASHPKIRVVSIAPLFAHAIQKNII